MRRATFYVLVKMIRERGMLQDSIHTSVKEQVSMFLHIVGHNQRFRVIHSSFKRYMDTFSRYFKQVLFAVGEHRGEMIKPPLGRKPPKIENSYIWWPYFLLSIKYVLSFHHMSTMVKK
jgi:hypothetical protein